MNASARLALVEGWPILLTAALVGTTFGVTARQSGLELVEISGMSLIIFAGASQFAAVELLRSGAAVPAVILAAFLINLRHLLMATALRPRFAARSLPERLGLAYVLTDEAFAMGVGWYRRGRGTVTSYAVFGTGLWLAWNLATVAGALLSDRIAEPRRLGVDFAITASFLSIVALAVRGRTDVAIALIAAGASATLALSGASIVAVIGAGALAPLATFVLPRARP